MELETRSWTRAAVAKLLAPLLRTKPPPVALTCGGWLGVWRVENEDEEGDEEEENGGGKEEDGRSGRDGAAEAAVTM